MKLRTISSNTTLTISQSPHYDRPAQIEFINLSNLQSWELRILNVLNWDTSAVLPHDLLDHFLHRLPIPDQVKSRVTYHARTLINMCCTGTTS